MSPGKSTSGGVKRSAADASESARGTTKKQKLIAPFKAPKLNFNKELNTDYAAARGHVSATGVLLERGAIVDLPEVNTDNDNEKDHR